MVLAGCTYWFLAWSGLRPIDGPVRGVDTLMDLGAIWSSQRGYFNGFWCHLVFWATCSLTLIFDDSLGLPSGTTIDRSMTGRRVEARTSTELEYAQSRSRARDRYSYHGR